MTQNTTYGGGYSLADLDNMGGDEIRAMDRTELRRMRRDALREAKLAVARAERATDYLAMTAAKPSVERAETANAGEIKVAYAFLDKVVSA